MTGFLSIIWVGLMGFFAFAGYRAAFITPESEANRWEDGAAFTFLLIVLVSWLLWLLSAPKGRHED